MDAHSDLMLPFFMSASPNALIGNARCTAMRTRSRHLL